VQERLLDSDLQHQARRLAEFDELSEQGLVVGGARPAVHAVDVLEAGDQEHQPDAAGAGQKVADRVQAIVARPVGQIEGAAVLADMDEARLTPTRRHVDRAVRSGGAHHTEGRQADEASTVALDMVEHLVQHQLARRSVKAVQVRELERLHRRPPAHLRLVRNYGPIMTLCHL
jgi:hypothetical protein